MSGIDNSFGTGNRDIKKLLGNPKITFVLGILLIRHHPLSVGGPASGKGTQCAKLVEEFGYKHISVGDLMRAEKDKGTKDGERIRKIMNDGGLVPFELTVNILINGLIANPSKNYLIDGFPRAVDQAIYFEQNVCECQNVIFYDVSEEVLLERCLVRATNAAVQREDDNEETLKKRLRAFKELSKPVVELYQKFGKVKWIDAGQSIGEVFFQTRRAMLPEIFFMIGPKCSGKTTLGNALADRTNMTPLNFTQFVRENGLKSRDDETQTMALIKHLVNETAPRILLEDFPQNETQAKFFIKNCIPPSEVFYLTCSKDTCQERMIDIGKEHPNYVSSAILSKKIKKFHDNAVKLLPFLKANTSYHEVNTEQTFCNAFKELSQIVEPVVIHVRSGGSANELRKEMIERLCDEMGFTNLDVNSLIRDENERKTTIGNEFLSMVAAGKIIPAEMIVRMLRKIIYSGDGRKKYILSSFPDIIEQAKEFEKSCATISAIIYTTSADPVVEIKNNNLTLFNIDALFQKEFRLKTMDRYDYSYFTHLTQKNVSWVHVIGGTLTGKTSICNLLAKNFGYKIINMKDIEDQIRKSKQASEDAEPYEGPIDINEVNQALMNLMQRDSKDTQFVVDGYIHKNVDDLLQIYQDMNPPKALISLRVSLNAINDRYKKKNEVEEIPEEVQQQLFEASSSGDQSHFQSIASFLEDYCYSYGTRIEPLENESSNETLLNQLKEIFLPKVILVNHEKRLAVDTTCANLAIKYNFLYISVYQTIKYHIENNTDYGKRLQATKKQKKLQMLTQAKDEFQEVDYSAAHFDLDLVVELIKYTISQVRRGDRLQRFIILEGFCNSGKCEQFNDQLQLRNMDELFMIEKHIGEVQAVIGLQFQSEKEYIEEHEIVFEEFPEPEVKEAKKIINEEGEEVEEQPPAEEEGENKAPKFKPEEYRWTKTDRKSKNLPQLFMQTKGIAARHEVRTAEQFSSSQYEAISKSLDEFCAKVVELNEGTEKYIYQQVLFNE